MHAGAPPAGTVEGYARRRPETTTLYKVVLDNLQTLYAAAEAGFAGVPLPAFVRSELDGFLACGLLCRGFAVLECGSCRERRLVAFSCKGRGFCPSCGGRRMAEVSLNLLDHVLPKVALRQWVFTLPYPLRARVAYDGPLLGAVGRIFVDSVLGFYRRHLRARGVPDGQSGAVTVVQRTQADLRLAPHFHAIVLDGIYVPDPDGLGPPVFRQLPRLSTQDVADVLQIARVRILKFLVRRNIVEAGPDACLLPDDLALREPALAQLAAAAVSGLPPAGPELRRKPVVVPLPGRPGVTVAGPLCCDELGFGLHAATTAGAENDAARARLVRYVLRPPIASDRVTQGPDDLVRILLRKPFKDGTTAIDLDPLSLLSRLAVAVPPPRFNTIRYAGVLAAHAKWRPLVVPPPPPPDPANAPAPSEKPPPPATHRCRYRPWLELLRRTFDLDLSACACGGKMKLRALIKDPDNIARYLQHLGEPTVPPPLADARGPPFWKSSVLRRRHGAPPPAPAADE